MTITTLPVDMQLDGHMRAAATERHRATAEAGGSKIGVKGVYGDCPKLEATKTGYHRQRATYVVKGGPSANFGMPGVEYDFPTRYLHVRPGGFDVNPPTKTFLKCTTSQEEDAALKIQSAIRAREARKVAGGKREEVQQESASLVIQGATKQRKARGEVQRRKDIIEDAEIMFQEIDDDNSGTLSYKELRKALDSTQATAFAELITKWEDKFGTFRLSAIDADSQDGQITWPEFRKFIVSMVNSV